jgi:hypothetical protein
MDETPGVALALKTGVPSYHVEDEEGRTHLLIHLAIEEEDEDRCAPGGPITQALIRGRSFGVLSSRNRRVVGIATGASLRQLVRPSSSYPKASVTLRAMYGRNSSIRARFLVLANQS